jgi:hypothetical protein
MPKPAQTVKSTKNPAPPKLPTATAAGAAVQCWPNGTGHPIVLEVTLVDSHGKPFVLPIRFGAALAQAIGVQLRRDATKALTLATPKQRSKQ